MLRQPSETPLLAPGNVLADEGIDLFVYTLNPKAHPQPKGSVGGSHGSMHARHPNWVFSYLDNRSTARSIISRIGVVGLIGEFISVKPCISYYLGSTQTYGG